MAETYIGQGARVFSIYLFGKLLSCKEYSHYSSNLIFYTYSSAPSAKKMVLSRELKLLSNTVAASVLHSLPPPVLWSVEVFGFSGNFSLTSDKSNL